MRRIDALLRWPVRSIRRRLLFALLVPMGLVLVATSPLDFQLAVGPSRQAYDDALAIEAKALADQVRMQDGQLILNLDRQAERVLRANAGDDEYFAVRDTQGRLLGGDQSLPIAQPAAIEDVRFSDETVAIGANPARPVRMVTVWRPVDEAVVVVQVAETLNKRQAAERRILAAMVLPNVATALGAALLVYLATRLTVAPLEHLAQQVAQRSPNDLRPIEIEHPPIELAQVLAALNRLFGRVHDSAMTQQRFHANVAHQLRTPLTGLRTQIELAQMEGAFAGEDSRHERILSAIDGLTHLMDQLLTLSRAEAGTMDGSVAGSDATPIDLRALIEDRASMLVDQAIDRGIDLGFQLGDAVVPAGVPVLLGELLNNLVDNALRYCPRGSVVTVSCGQDEGQPWLAVEDDGPGIPPDQREQMFARFHRGHVNSAEGSGLGLAIVQEIAAVHGARVAALTPSHGKGVRFEVRWGDVNRTDPAA